jgi:SAM-dependent methyltransferase
MEFRLIFDTIPERFDRHRPRYTPELFAKLIDAAKVAPGSKVLELGPGTGQATEPVLRTGCDYCAIELGEQLCRMMRQKFGGLPNFSIIHDDFITYDFGTQQFDLVYSAATIQWIPEEIAYPKCFSLLRPGGMLAMMYLTSDYKTPNPDLYENIQQVYAAHYKPETPYQNGRFHYDRADAYGFGQTERYEFRAQRILTAEEYVGYCGTHCDHLTIAEPHRSLFFDGLRKAVLEAGDRIVFEDTFVLHLAKKPE